MIIPIGKNDWSYGNKNAIYEEMKKTKKFIKNYHPECKNIFISSLILCFHNKKAVSVLKSYINILKSAKCFLHDSINESHLQIWWRHIILCSK